MGEQRQGVRGRIGEEVKAKIGQRFGKREEWGQSEGGIEREGRI